MRWLSVLLLVLPAFAGETVNDFSGKERQTPFNLRRRGEPTRPEPVVPRRFLQVVDGPDAPRIETESGEKDRIALVEIIGGEPQAEIMNGIIEEAPESQDFV